MQDSNHPPMQAQINNSIKSLCEKITIEILNTEENKWRTLARTKLKVKYKSINKQVKEVLFLADECMMQNTTLPTILFEKNISLL